MSLRASWAWLALVALAAGCGDDESSSSESDDPSETSSGQQKGDDTPSADLWTEEPALDDIPDQPVEGIANGQPFSPKTIYFEPRFNHWAMALTEAKLDEPTGVPPAGTQTLFVTDLPQPIGRGTYRRPMTEGGGGYWQVPSPEDPSRLTSWVAPQAYVLEITKWDVKPWDPKGMMFQLAGRASGRVMIVYRGEREGYENSWVAGTFEDAPVRYMGKPRWVTGGGSQPNSADGDGAGE